jgi:cytochrome c oxidase subunit 2
VDSPADFQAWVENQRMPAVSFAAATPPPAPAAAADSAATPSAPETANGAPASADSTAPVAPPASAAEVPDAAASAGDSLSWTGGVVGDAAKGAALFQRSACVACHTINGTPAQGKVGPNLTHVGSRQRIAAERLPNDPESMALWLHDPPALKPGALMPNLNLKPEQIADLVAYLESLK